MSFEIITILPFDSQLKKLAKKSPSIIKDLARLEESLKENPFQGEALVMEKVLQNLRSY